VSPRLLSPNARALAAHLARFAMTKGLTLSEAANVLLPADQQARGYRRPTPEEAERAKAALAELLVFEVVVAWLGTPKAPRSTENAIYRLAPGWGDIDFAVDSDDEAEHPEGMTSRP
jgi:hypothetical protein